MFNQRERERPAGRGPVAVLFLQSSTLSGSGACADMFQCVSEATRAGTQTAVSRVRFGSQCTVLYHRAMGPTLWTNLKATTTQGKKANLNLYNLRLGHALIHRS